MEGREDVAAPNHTMTRQGLQEQPILPVLVRLAMGGEGRVLAAALTYSNVVITFGPLELSGHPDHVAVHRATVAAFHRYRRRATAPPRLYYKALLPAAMQALGLTLAGPEVQPTVLIDIAAQKALKVRVLRTYTTQEDAQRLARLIEQSPWAVEAFHQAYPPMPEGILATGFWEMSDSAG
jgi:LmbE family N-acetylglucosaminyl deacetylase